MPDYILDSCILIRHLRRHQPTTDLMTALALEGQLSIATISRTEIVEGMREHEREATLRLLNSLSPFHWTLPLPIWLGTISAISAPGVSRWTNQMLSLEPRPSITT